MPIYEYICPACGNTFEKLRPLSQSDKDSECPSCHKPAQRKLSTFTCFNFTTAGVLQRIAGTGGGSSCSSCSSGNCSTCGS